MVKKNPPALKKKATSTKKSTAKKPTSKKSVAKKVDIYPNRMTVAISALAGTLLVLITIISVLGSRG